jgi:hypothetical protein
MAKPGPAKGSGGRPRTAKPAARAGDGYKRVTVGAKGKGTQVYQHRAKAGLAGTKGSKSGKTGGVVDHKNRNTSDNRKSNLRVGTKAANNRNRGK